MFSWRCFSQDSRYYGCGTTDGTFKGVRYFTCPDKNGLFLSLASVAKKPEWLNLQYHPHSVATFKMDENGKSNVLTSANT